MVNIDDIHKSPIKPGEDEAIKRKIEQCHIAYQRKGKGALIEIVVKLFIEVRRLSYAVETKNNELKELRK